MRGILLLGVSLLMLSGCVAIPDPVPLSQDFLDEKDKKVAVIVTELPVGDFITLGQQGLLDLAINEGANSELNKHLASLDITEFNDVTGDFERKLAEFSIETVDQITGFQLPDSLESFRGGDSEHKYARTDYRFLEKQTSADRVILISLPSVGVTRAYSGFIPTGEPHGHVTAEARIIDLESNRLLWLSRNEINLDIEEPWDEAPAFPNATTAVYQALEQARLMMLQDFKVLPKTDSVAAEADALN